MIMSCMIQSSLARLTVNLAKIGMESIISLGLQNIKEKNPSTMSHGTPAPLSKYAVSTTSGPRGPNIDIYREAKSSMPISLLAPKPHFESYVHSNNLNDYYPREFPGWLCGCYYRVQWPVLCLKKTSSNK